MATKTTRRTKAPAKPAQNRGTITLSHATLSALVEPVIVHADTGNTLPILEAVHFTTRDGYLLATATDRYCVAFCRVKVDADVDFGALVPARNLRALLKMFKPSRFQTGEVTLTVDASVTMNPHLTVEGPSAMFSNATVRYDLQAGEFPSLTGVFAKLADASDAGTIGLNPRFLARFAKAAPANVPIQVTSHGPKSPVFVTVGEDFFGAIMPVKLTDETTTGTDWGKFLGIDTKVEARAS